MTLGESDAPGLSSLGLVRRIWRLARSRSRTVAAIGVACALETAFYWLVPLSFRALVDAALGERNERALLVVLA